MAAFEHGFGAGAFWAWFVMALLLLGWSAGLDIVQIDDENGTVAAADVLDTTVAAAVTKALQSTDEQDEQDK